jgi:hypothetical protein
MTNNDNINSYINSYNQSNSPPKPVIRMGQMEREGRESKCEVHLRTGHEGPEGE